MYQLSPGSYLLVFLRRYCVRKPCLTAKILRIYSSGFDWHIYILGDSEKNPEKNFEKGFKNLKKCDIIRNA